MNFLISENQRITINLTDRKKYSEMIQKLDEFSEGIADSGHPI